MVLTLAIICYFYWTYVSLTISFFLHELLQKHKLYWTIRHANSRTLGCNWTQRNLLFQLQRFSGHLPCIRTVELNYECWNNRRHTNMAWLHDQRCRIKEHASGSPTSPSSCSRVFFALTNIVPIFHRSDTSKKLYLQLLDLVHHTVPFTNMILQNWTGNIVDWCACGPASWHQLGITMARDFVWMEQRSTDAVGLRWTEILACYLHRHSLEIWCLCCNFTPWTINPHNFQMKHPTT